MTPPKEPVTEKTETPIIENETIPVDDFLKKAQDEIKETIEELQGREELKNLSENLKTGLNQLKDSTAGILEKGANYLRVEKPAPEPEEPEEEKPPQPREYTRIQATRVELDQKQPQTEKPEPRPSKAPIRMELPIFKEEGYITTQENWGNLKKSTIKYEYQEKSLTEFNEKALGIRQTGVTPIISYDPQEKIVWIKEYSGGIKIIWAKYP